jgi:hypothetical protein
MECIVCGKILTKTQKKFCSQKCHGKTMLGENNPTSKPEVKEKLSKQFSGKNNPMFGTHRSGKESPFWGKRHSEETKQKISKSRIIKGVAKEEKNPRYGKPFKHTKEAKEKIRLGHIGKPNSPEHSKHISEGLLGKPKSLEAITNMRLAAIRRIKRQKKISNMSPSFNEDACKYFEQFDIDHHTKGLYGKNEYLIEDLGYWPDYINFDLKLIMEWDEKAHYKNGQLREKDILRQQQIQARFPDFSFKRIAEWEAAHGTA